MSETLNPIELFRGFRDHGCYTWSPFVTKLELRLRHGGVPYSSQAGSPRSAPNGKIPYVDIGPLLGHDHSVYLGDSWIIVKRLMELGRLQSIESKQDQLSDLAVRSMLENRLYFFSMRDRWIENYYIQRDKALWQLPFPIRFLVGMLVYRNVSNMLYGQGTGRYSSEEVTDFVTDIWQSLSQSLERSRKGTKTGQVFWLFGGTQPTEADTTLFGFIVSALVAESGPKNKAIVKSFPILEEYATRIHNQYFPDYEKWS